MAKLRVFSVDADSSSGDQTGEGTNGGGLALPDKLPSTTAVPVAVDPTTQDTPAQTTPTATPDIDLPDKKSNLQDVYSQVQGTDPDRAAKVVAIQNKINEPAAYIDKNLDSVQRAMAAPQGSFFKQLEDQYPGTTQFLSDPRNMAVAQDDLPNVADHEGLIQNAAKEFSIYDAFKYGLESSSAGLITRGKTPDITMPSSPSLMQSLSAQAGGLIGDLPAMALGGALGGVAGATAGATAGSPGLIPGMAAGAAIGGTAGGAAGAFAFPAALKAALIQKYQNGEITSYSDILKEAAKQGIVGLATAGSGGLAAKTIGGTLAPLAAEVTGMTVAGKGVEGQLPTGRDFLENALTVGALHGATALPEGLSSILQDQKSQYSKDFYTALGNTAEASKLRERLPEAHQELIQSLTKDGPVENVYIPADAAQSYFQSKNLDPDQVMADLGVTKSFDEAKQTGGDIQIPLSTWVSKVVGTEHFQGLADDIKFDPEDLTARQVSDRKAEIQSQVQEIMDQRKAQADAQAAEQAKQEDLDHASDVFQKIQSQLKDAGLSSPETEFNPKLHEAFFNTLGEHLGVDPSDLMDRFPLKIGKFESPEDANARSIEEAATPDERMAAQNQDEKTNEQASITAPEDHVYHQHELIEGTNVVQAKFGKEPDGSKSPEETGVPSVMSSDERLERFSAKFGEGKGSKKIKKAILDAQDEAHPSYIKDEKIPGGIVPNFESKPTGTIGLNEFQEPHGARPDPLSWYDMKFGATKDLIEKHAKEGVPLTINTSSDMVAHDDYIEKMPKDTTIRMHMMPRDGEIGRSLFRGSPSLGRQESAVEKLRSEGIKVEVVRPTADQIIESAGGIDTVAEKLGVTPEEARKKIGFSAGLRSLNQGAPKVTEAGPRGRIRIGKEGYAIDLFKNADRSTFLHETGHYFLDVMGHIASDESAPEGVKQDYQTILKWLGVGSMADIGTEEHEKFARGFEQYLMEGKAPSSALTRAFGRFRKWLTSVYKSAKNLNVDMSDDVRGVMDRMLASESEVDRAQKSIGMGADSVKGVPPELEAKIHDLQSQARDQAESSLLKEQMGELTKLHKDFLVKERAKQQDLAENQVDELPLYKASDEAVATIGKDRTAGTIAEKFLSEKLKAPDMGKFEALAEVHGFGSGEELAHGIILSEEGKSREQEINSRVEAGMAPHADLMNTDAIRTEALKSVHNEKMTELLALEREAMFKLVNKASVNQEVSKRSRMEAKVDAQAAKEQAREILAAKPVKDATNSRTYITAERNAAVKAAKAMAKGDFEKAAEFKRQQMLNHAIASEAMRNEVEAKKSISYLSDFAHRKNDLKDMPYGFTRQIDQLLSKSGFAEPRFEDSGTLTTIAKDMASRNEDPSEIANRTGYKQDANGNWTPESLPDFVTRANDNYYAMNLPDSVMSGADKNYQDLTLSDLRDLKNSVKTIADIGKKYDRFLGEFKTADVKSAAAQFLSSITEKFGTPFSEELQPGSQHETKLSEFLSTVGKLPGIFDRQLDSIMTTCHKFDGLEEGPAKEFIYRPLEEAASRETAKVAEKMKEIDAIFAKHYGLDEFAKYKDTRINVDGRYFTKEEILSMALNWGNEANRDRLMSGFGFDEGKMQRIFSNLDKKDWDFAQDTWNHIDKYWPDISKLEMDVNGVEPGKVQPTPFQNQHGSYEGGYYPIKYDFEKSADAYQNQQQKDALYKQFSTAAAHTDQGHAKARVQNVTRPLLLDLSVIKGHHEDVIHDLEFRRAVIDVNRFLNQRDVKNGIVNAVGVQGYGSIGDWLKSAAGGASEPLTMFDKAAQWLRFKTSFFNMGYRIVSAPKIAFENLINLSSEVGVSHAAGALKEYYFGDSGMHDMVTGKSDFMRLRGEHLNRDLSDIQAKWQGASTSSENFQGKFQKFAFFVHSYLDQGVSFPLWADVYKRGLSDHGEEKLAVNQADEAVKRTFMSGGSVDQPAIMRGSEKQKALTTAYGYQSMMWNRFSMQKFEASQAWIQGNHTAALSIAARTAVYTFLMPALTAALTKELLRNSQSSNPQDRDKRVASNIAEEMSPLKFVPVLRDISPYLIKKALGEKGNDLQVTPLEEAAQTLLTPIGEALHAFGGNGVPDKFGEHTANAVSLLSGVPKEINDVVFNFIDWQQHNGQLTWRDAISRKSKH